ncbi:MAG: superoxide dismutase [Bacteroidales bacterium]|nr:superoxide dismutase [Bacteroidales bacterium]
MKFLAIENENTNEHVIFSGELLREEALKVHQLYLDGIIREIYFNDDHCAVLMLECKSKEEAEEILSSLPLVQNGLISFSLTQLKPYTGFERLFNS